MTSAAHPRGPHDRHRRWRSYISGCNDDLELREVWAAADQIGGPFGALVKLLMLTGQRRDEVAKMEWSEVDMNTRLWTLPKHRSKNGEAHDIPLNDPAIAILQALPRIGDRFVLTTDGETPSSNYAKNKKRLDALLPPDMPAWWLHDIRRTAASGMARLGVNLPTIEKVLNHASGSFAGIVAVYQRHDFADEKRRALDAWGAQVKRIVSGKAGSVVPLRENESVLRQLRG
jgi:integrase